MQEIQDGKIYAGMQIDRVCRVTEGLIEDEQGSFQSGWDVWNICLLWSIWEKKHW